MNIRDGHATLNGKDEVINMESGTLEIIADDGRTLFTVGLQKDGSIRIDSGHFCKHNGIILDDSPMIIPQAANSFFVKRPEYKEIPKEPTQ